MSETLFEKIINKEIPSDIIYEDDQSIVIKDINPQAPVHLLIIPKKPIPMLSKATESDKELLGHLMLVAGKLSKLLKLDDTFISLLIMEKMQGKPFFIYTCTYSPASHLTGCQLNKKYKQPSQVKIL